MIVRTVDWYRRLSDDVVYRRKVRELQMLGEMMFAIFYALQKELERPMDLSGAGALPEGKKRLPPPPPRKGRG